VKARHFAVLLGAVTSASWTLLSAPGPSASAQPCPDVEVVFARGTTEDPGVGPTGQAFVDSLRARIGTQSIGVYPVDYPATLDFATAVAGISDASAHVRSTAANCPKTKLVLGGFSQGAAVMGFVTANVIPDGVDAADVPAPLPADVANHVATVALLGKPSTRFMRAINEPLIAVGPLYADKTIDLCLPDDPICSSSGRDFSAHTEYVEAGMVDQAATFAAGRLRDSDRATSDPRCALGPGCAPPETLAQLAAPGRSAELPR
jgi:cutinase